MRIYRGKGLPVLRTMFFPSHWLLSHITTVERERGMKSCGNDYHQSAERILAEPGIEPE